MENLTRDQAESKLKEAFDHVLSNLPSFSNDYIAEMLDVLGDEQVKILPRPTFSASLTYLYTQERATYITDFCASKGILPNGGSPIGTNYTLVFDELTQPQVCALEEHIADRGYTFQTWRNAD